MIILIEDKIYRRTHDFKWTDEKVSAYSKLKVIEDLQIWNELKLQLTEMGIVVIIHEGIKGPIEDLYNDIESNPLWSLIRFSGSRTSSVELDGVGYTSERTVYGNLKEVLEEYELTDTLPEVKSFLYGAGMAEYEQLAETRLSLNQLLYALPFDRLNEDEVRWLERFEEQWTDSQGYGPDMASTSVKKLLELIKKT